MYLRCGDDDGALYNSYPGCSFNVKVQYQTRINWKNDFDMRNCT